MLLLDSDTKSSASTKKMYRPDRLRTYGIDPEVDVVYLGESEFEDLFSDRQWAQLANAEWPRVDNRPWAPEDIAELRGAKFSDELLRTFREASVDGPSTKPEVMTALAQFVTDATDLPGQLVVAFEHIEQVISK